LKKERGVKNTQLENQKTNNSSNATIVIQNNNFNNDGVETFKKNYNLSSNDNLLTKK